MSVRTGLRSDASATPARRSARSGSVPRRAAAVVASLLIALAAAAQEPALSTSSTAGCPEVVVRAYFDDPAMVAPLASWTEPWEVHAEEGYLVVGVDDGGLVRLLDAGFRVEVDERLTEQICQPARRLAEQTEGIPGYPCYRTVDETFAAARALATTYPDLVQVVDIGDSWEKVTGTGGHDMLVLKITSPAPGTPTGQDPPHGKPRLLVTSAIHARELATAELMTRFAEYLVSRYDSDPDVTWLLDEHEIHLLLEANPDGRSMVEAGEMSWRKNTDRAYCGPTSRDRGADLNRNFDYNWGCCGGSSSSECAEDYRGPTAHSEPEVTAIEAYERSIFPDQRGSGDSAAAPVDATGVYLDIHSYGEEVLWPWGFTGDPAPNGAALQTLGRRFAFRNGYDPKQAYGLYPTDGTTDDFAYGDLGVAAFTFEIGDSFYQDCTSFESTVFPANLAALLYAAKVARTPFLTPSGPDVTSLTIDGSPVVAPGEPVEVTALVDDTGFSEVRGTEPVQAITGAAATVDDPPWRDPAPAAEPFSAADGVFDSPVETATASIGTSGLAVGRHTMFVRGQDASGVWGPVTAAFFWVLEPDSVATIEGQVSDLVGRPLAATMTAGPFTTAIDPATGRGNLAVPPGTYDVTVTADGYPTLLDHGVRAVGGATTLRIYRMTPWQIALDDDVEAGVQAWSADYPWVITTETADSPTHSWTDSPGGDYSNSEDASLTSPVFDFSTADEVELEFSQRYALENGADSARVEYSPDGGASWELLASYTGTSGSGWLRTRLAIPGLAGAAQARIRFRLVSDGGIVADGWHVDDIVVRWAGPPRWVFEDTFEGGNFNSWDSWSNTEAVGPSLRETAARPVASSTSSQRP